MSLDLRKHGLTFAVASIAAQGKREGYDTPDQMVAYVLNALQSITVVEIRDMVESVVRAQIAADGDPQEFARLLREGCPS